MSTFFDELLERQSKDKKYQQRIKERDKKLSLFKKKLKADEENLVYDLAQVDVIVESVWDLVNSRESYAKAMPILLDHLEKKHHPRVLTGIARALAVPGTNNFEGSWEILISLYKNTISDHLISDPQQRGFKEGIAVALSALCNSPEKEKDLLKLINDEKNGTGRVFLEEKISKETIDNL